MPYYFIPFVFAFSCFIITSCNILFFYIQAFSKSSIFISFPWKSSSRRFFFLFFFGHHIGVLLHYLFITTIGYFAIYPGFHFLLLHAHILHLYYNFVQIYIAHYAPTTFYNLGNFLFIKFPIEHFHICCLYPNKNVCHELEGFPSSFPFLFFLRQFGIFHCII